MNSRGPYTRAIKSQSKISDTKGKVSKERILCLLDDAFMDNLKWETVPKPSK